MTPDELWELITTSLANYVQSEGFDINEFQKLLLSIQLMTTEQLALIIGFKEED